MKKRNVDLDQSEQPMLSTEVCISPIATSIAIMIINCHVQDETTALLQLCSQLQVQDYNVISQTVIRLREMFSRGEHSHACSFRCLWEVFPVLLVPSSDC